MISFSVCAHAIQLFWGTVARAHMEKKICKGVQLTESAGDLWNQSKTKSKIMNCLNLRELFGDQYRITFDEAYSSAHVPHDKRDPWMMQIPCTGRGVTIYPYGGNVLAVEVDCRPSIAAKVAAIDGVTLRQDGATEKTFHFDVSLFERVAQIVKPRKRRLLTETQLQALLKNQRRFEAGAQKSSLKRAQTPQADNFITQGGLALT
jgi:hypothetical protein